MIENRFKFLSGMHLKWIALIVMVIDHIAGFFPAIYSHYPTWLIYIRIGRIGFPLFCFLIAEGFVHTKSRKKYFFTVLIFAFISEIAFDWTNHHLPLEFIRGQNAIFTLAIGIIALWIIEKYKDNKLLQLVGVVACMALSTLINSEYAFFGVGLIAIMYVLRNRFIPLAVLGSLWLYVGNGLYALYYTRYIMPVHSFLEAFSRINFNGLLELYGALAFLFIFFYNGRRGHSFNKYFFYVFYPAHLILLYYLGRFLYYDLHLQ